jgi:retinol-binding protein 3
MPNRAIRCSLILVLTSCTASPGSSTTPPGIPVSPSSVASAAAPPTFTDADKHRALAAIFPLIDAHYVFPDVGTKMIAALRVHEAHGDYASLTTELAFAKQVTIDMRAISHDRHCLLRYDSDGVPGPTRDEEEHDKKLHETFGFVSTSRLPGDIAVLRIDAFLEPPTEAGVKETYAKRMSEVSDAKALILDLRNNFGGDPDTVALLLGYVFGDEKVHVNDIWIRDGNETFASWTDPHVAGKRFGKDKPLYVLTSKETISGGEEAAYDLQTQKRATIIGEVTAGAANPAPRHKISPHLTLCVPFGRAINPITHTNWEGVGVVPDVQVDPAHALEEAVTRARREIEGLSHP